MRKEHCAISTVGELRRFIEELPEEMPVVRLTEGCYQVNLAGVFAFVGDLPMGDERPVQKHVQTVMCITA